MSAIFVERSWIKNSRRNLFSIADTNGDGQMTFAEWCDSALHSTFYNENNSTLYEQWAKYDTANVGYLIEDEAINRRA